MGRKAALNLGISTIVVLVIAMVVIGSSVSFIRTLFSEGEDVLIGTFPAKELNPTRDEPLVLESNTITLKQGERKVVRTAVYNRESQRHNFTIELPGCTNTTGGNVDTISLISRPASIESGGKIGMRGTLTAEVGTTQGSPFICEIRAKSDVATYTKQIDVEVTT